MHHNVTTQQHNDEFGHNYVFIVMARKIIIEDKNSHLPSNIWMPPKLQSQHVVTCPYPCSKDKMSYHHLISHPSSFQYISSRDI